MCLFINATSGPGSTAAGAPQGHGGGFALDGPTKAALRVGAAVLAAPVLEHLVIGAVHAAGFGPGGVAAGSLAARLMAAGSGVTPHFVSALQSIGAKSALLNPAVPVLAVAAVVSRVHENNALFHRNPASPAPSAE